MNEMMALRELGERMDVPEHPPPALRRRVLDPTPPRRRRFLEATGVRLVWRIAVPAAVAAVGLAMLISQTGVPQAPGDDRATGTRATADAPGAGTAETAGSGKTVPDAGQVLHLAAQYVTTAPEPVVHPDQFVYTESIERGLIFRISGNPDGTNRTMTPFVDGPNRVQRWRSVSDTRDGLERSAPDGSGKAGYPVKLPGCRDGRRAETLDRPEHTVPCTPLATALPTDEEGMLAYLRRPQTDGENFRYGDTLSAEQLAFLRVGQVLTVAAHRNDVRRAVYAAAARIPAVTVVPDVVDAAGRHGLGLVRTTEDVRVELIFDPSTYAYLGVNHVAVRPVFQDEGVTIVDPDGVLAAGHPLYQEAILRVAAVPTTDQQP